MLAMLLLSSVALAPPARAGSGNVSVSVLQTDGKPVVGAIITLHALDAALRPAPPMRAAMDQINLAFEPDVLVISVGSTVEFPNTDTTRHQVYSFSAAHPFQLPLYRGKPYPPEHFDRAGLVTLGCNIHDDMLAYILVTDAPYFGRTDAAGNWSASTVPRGRYRVEVWHPRGRDAAHDLERELRVGDTERAEVTIRLQRALRPAPLEGSPHSWDAY
ncbi:MAG TPA: carboxypeptidase regulatory-like domain-containing protein [Steroidobacteraceae bacterium]|nr:carboxypeptidase regulatory-like domain-containing protein [Steroidobacteraceae bacterium]